MISIKLRRRASCVGHTSLKPIEETITNLKKYDNDETQFIQLHTNAGMRFFLCDECMFTGPVE